jgi:hypothetical protein
MQLSITEHGDLLTVSEYIQESSIPDEARSHVTELSLASPFRSDQTSPLPPPYLRTSGPMTLPACFCHQRSLTNITSDPTSPRVSCVQSTASQKPGIGTGASQDSASVHAGHEVAHFDSHISIISRHTQGLCQSFLWRHIRPLPT